MVSPPHEVEHEAGPLTPTGSLAGEPLELRHLAAAVRTRLFKDVEVSARVGHYTLLERIGTGGAGVVFTARDEQLGRTVAVKVQRGGLSEADRLRALREAQALARLSHPNVVPVFEIGEEDGRIYIVMEFVAGATLRAWLAQASRSRAQLLDVLTQAGRGLAAAHAAGIVHRDFKPDNVMLGTDGRVRVVDFGLARATDAPPSAPPRAFDAAPAITQGLVGTPAYMAPEQFLGEPADARSDQFSFCKVAWEALHGESPHAGSDIEAIRAAVLADEVRLPARAHVPRHVQLALRRGLRRDPAARHAAMEPLLAALDAGRGRGFAAAIVVAAFATAATLSVVLAGTIGTDDNVPEAMNIEAAPPASTGPRGEPLPDAPGPADAERRAACAALRHGAAAAGAASFSYQRTLSVPVANIQASYYDPAADEVVLFGYDGAGARVTRDGVLVGRVAAPRAVAPLLDGAALDPLRGTALLLEQSCIAADVDLLDITARAMWRIDFRRHGHMLCVGLAIGPGGTLYVANHTASEVAVLSPDAGEKLGSFPVYVGELDGIVHIPATGHFLVFGWDGSAEVVTPTGEVFVGAGPIGEAPPLRGGGSMSVPDGGHVVCKTGEFWLCEGLNDRRECRIFAPDDGGRDACACLGL